jgi:hypothetical protein
MELDVLRDPLAVAALRVDRVVLAAHHRAHLVHKPLVAHVQPPVVDPRDLRVSCPKSRELSSYQGDLA